MFSSPAKCLTNLRGMGLQSPFPRVFPYSSTVPEIFAVLKRYVDSCLNFVENLDLSQTEIDQLVRRAVNILLAKTLGRKR
jgi:hypothetical protein